MALTLATTMAKRGAELRTHMLYAAKDVFLEVGFERTSMDQIATRAGTTKRTLYAHFANKEGLFLAVFELILALQLEHLKGPADYGPDPAQALVLFCGRFLETVLSDRPLRFFRLAIAEAGRFPQGTVQLHEAVFEHTQTRIAQFLEERLGLSAAVSQQVAQQLLAYLLYPRFTRALFGAVSLLAAEASELGAGPAIDLEDLQKTVSALLPR